MGRVPITVLGYRCERCGHEWIPLRAGEEPKVCPRCHSPYWNTQRKQAPMTYEEFRDKIKAALTTASAPLTWTDVRASAGLPQQFPNNQWVRRMEQDIALRRERDVHGIIHWRLGTK